MKTVLKTIKNGIAPFEFVLGWIPLFALLALVLLIWPETTLLQFSVIGLGVSYAETLAQRIGDL